jgi:uncharacterized protein (UPF0335 family)
MEVVGNTEPRKARSRVNGHEKPLGRKEGADGQEAVPNLTELKKGMPKAIKLEKEMADMRSDASEFYKKFAKNSGLNAAQLRNAAKAYANDEREAALRKAEQTSLIFEECGDQS